MMVINVRKMIKAGCKVKILIADWFACIQNKFDGDLTKIRTIGFYMIEIWKEVGLELNGVEFIWLSDEINNHSDEYWALVMDISRNNTLRTIIRYSYVYTFPSFISFTNLGVLCYQIICWDKQVKLFKEQVLWNCGSIHSKRRSY